MNLGQFALLASVLLITPGISKASDSEFSRRSLIGLRGLAVIVEALEPEAQRAGLEVAAIRTDAELKLRLAGIQVLSGGEYLSSPGRPYLYIRVIARQPPFLKSVFTFSIAVELNQTAKLDRDTTIAVTSTTWSEVSNGAVGTERIDELRGVIKDLVDQFINAYLSVNPKK